MYKQRGTICGIDTCSIKKCGKFDFNSKLMNNAEARAILNCPNINALLTQLG